MSNSAVFGGPFSNSASLKSAKFVLDGDTIAALKAAVADDPAKQQRLEEQLREMEAKAARRRALEERREKLIRRNAALREVGELTPPPASLGMTTTAALGGGSEDVMLVGATPLVSSPEEEVELAAATAMSVPSKVAKKAKTPPAAKVVSQPPAVKTTAKVEEKDKATEKPWEAEAGEEEFAALSAYPDPASQVADTWGQQRSLFRYAGPTLQGLVSCVVDTGILYRIVTDRGEWAFYNDTLYYRVHVCYRLDGGSNAVAGPSVQVRKVGGDATSKAAVEFSMVLGPEETAVLFSGSVAGFHNLSKAELLPEERCSEEKASRLCAEPLGELARLRSAGGSGPLPSTSEAALAVSLKANLRFVDVAFLPGHSSLYRTGVDDFYISPLHWRSVKKVVPAEVAVDNIRPFCGPLAIEGIRQGSLLPDDHLLSIIMGLTARFPKGGWLRPLFRHPVSVAAGVQERRLGAYRVTLCQYGWWRHDLLDGYFPAATYCLEFARNALDLRELWLPLLEKAHAKLTGSYAAILQTPLGDVVGQLTGAPCCSLSPLWPSIDDLRQSSGKVELLFHAIKTYIQSDRGTMFLRPFSVNTTRRKAKRDRLEALYEELGLRPGFCTVVIGIEMLDEGRCVMRLQQTAAKTKPMEDWMQVWRNAAKPWVEDISDVAFALNDVDSLWMDLEDLPQYFQCAYAVPKTIGWGEVRVLSRFENHNAAVAMRIEVHEKTRVIAYLTQHDAPEVAGAEKRKNSGGRKASEQQLGGISLAVYARRGPRSPETPSGSEEVLAPLGFNSAPDVFDLKKEPNFIYERDAATGVELSPERSPYYFIPRLREDSNSVPYTLSVLVEPPSSLEKGAAQLTARFVPLMKSHHDGLRAQATLSFSTSSAPNPALQCQYRLHSTTQLREEEVKSVSFVG